MKIKQTVKTETEIEIKLPFFSKDDYSYYKVDENGMITVNDYLLLYNESSSTSFYENRITEAYFHQHISETEFNNKFETTKLLFNGI